MLKNKTYQPKAADIQRSWRLIDAQGKVLGRLATGISNILMGKNNPRYVPHLDFGDHVVVVNAQKVVVSGNKELKKIYWRHSGYPAGMKLTNVAGVRETHPERLIIHAVSGMLPKNKLRDRRLKRLHVFPGPTHPFSKLVSA